LVECRSNPPLCGCHLRGETLGNLEAQPPQFRGSKELEETILSPVLDLGTSVVHESSVGAQRPSCPSNDDIVYIAKREERRVSLLDEVFLSYQEARVQVRNDGERMLTMYPIQLRVCRYDVIADI
jgi:hypothetical protein